MTALGASLVTARCAADCGHPASVTFIATGERLCSECWWAAFEAFVRFRRCA